MSELGIYNEWEVPIGKAVSCGGRRDLVSKRTGFEFLLYSLLDV